MRHLLLLSLILLCPLFATEAKTDPAAAPVVTAADLKAATKTAVDAAWKAADDFHDTLKAEIASGVRGAAGQTEAGRKGDVFTAAMRAAIIAYFSEPDHTTPLPFTPTKAGQVDSPEVATIKVVNGKLLSLHARAVAGITTDPWGKDPNAPQDFGAKYGKAAHVEWLEDLCLGGAKHFAAKEKTTTKDPVAKQKH